jgi:hypothetical protein
MQVQDVKRNTGASKVCLLLGGIKSRKSPFVRDSISKYKAGKSLIIWSYNALSMSRFRHKTLGAQIHCLERESTRVGDATKGV